MRNATRIGLAVLFASSMVFYVQGILVPYQQRDAEIHNRPRGSFSDLYPRWLGARELLLHGRDPYSPEITREIQKVYYGRPLDPARPEDPKDEARFAYPVYVVFLFAPTIRLPFDLVETAFLWLLVALTATSALLWLDFLQWRPSAAVVTTVVLLTLGNFVVVQGFKLNQLSLLVSFLLALAAALLARGYFFTSGALVAVAMIKPHLVIPIAGWLFLWALSSWRIRRAWVFGFGLTMFAFLAASEWVMPGWIPRFVDAVFAYRQYASSEGLLEMLFSPTAGKLLIVLLLVIVFALCWRYRTFSQTRPEFQRISALVLTTTVVIIPMVSPYNQVLLIPSILLVARRWSMLCSHSLLTRALSISACVLIAWPWLATSGLMLLSAMQPTEQVQQRWAVPLFSSLFIPIAVFALQLVSIATQNSDKPESA